MIVGIIGKQGFLKREEEFILFEGLPYARKKKLVSLNIQNFAGKVSLYFI